MTGRYWRIIRHLIETPHSTSFAKQPLLSTIPLTYGNLEKQQEHRCTVSSLETSYFALSLWRPLPANHRMENICRCSHRSERFVDWLLSDRIPLVPICQYFNSYIQPQDAESVNY
ncbi:hypothetical protein E1B28_006911 [Marasmius oreades]|uniref:Uncharacterized protein n=1 Tax=Marasmius oreades TaxID=181124 RepID=A0A9P7S0U7_9AGAR|nr:uncharacterized protein E1B28_006911 [Marasmius oreades]KAG7093225.1 hypothetical protein E1B28_006911 [Marasmius oreades]